ncbi:MAG: tetratricopeptide repeat-containing glycosyltransferase family protein [Verrucomicrobium sp.]|nr:tetratricopeptide repeat-containing glycosyltransferase family protein [Verrucomicrobium sp.]
MSAVAPLMAALQQGRIDEAAVLRGLEPVLAQDPTQPEALSAAGFCLLRLGKAAEAVQLLDLALQRQPDHWMARVNRAEALRAAGRPAEAAADYERALAQRAHPELWVNLAAALQAAGGPAAARAIPALEEALRLDPDSFAAWNNLGLHREDAGQMEEALACFEKAASLVPPGTEEEKEVAENLQRLFFEKGEAHRKDETPGAADRARAFYEGAIARYPHLAGLYLSQGNFWLDQCEMERARATFAKLLELEPENPVGLVNYGVALNFLGRPQEALDCYARAEKRNPDEEVSARLRWNRSFSLLALGRLREGFRDYEERFGQGHVPRLSGLRWEGGAFSGKTLLLQTEQGFGDAIQFVRYAVRAKALSPDGRVVAACGPALTRLFQRARGIDAVVPLDNPGPYDFQIPLMSLPLVFGTEAATIPGEVPYFDLPAGPRAPGPLRIGLVWSGNPKFQNDRRRSCPLSLLAPLGALPGTEWHSLQYGPAAGEAAAHPWLRGAPADLADFYETALRMQELDLILSVDTAAGHLAGALGRPLWFLLPHASEWRWLRDRDDSPWYPTARLFRQPAEGDWAGLVRALEAALREKARK